jgi:hypothetical protein
MRYSICIKGKETYFLIDIVQALLYNTYCTVIYIDVFEERCIWKAIKNTMHELPIVLE